MGLRTTGDVLKEYRIRHGLSQPAFASMLGYKDRTTISKLESGENSIPASRIAEVAKKLGMTEKYLSNELERALYALDVVIEYRGTNVRVYDEDRGVEVLFDNETWERLKSEADFRSVWEALQAAQPGEEAVISDSAALSDRATRVGILYDRADERDQRLVDTVLEPYDDGTIPMQTIRAARGGVLIYDEPTAAGFGNYLSSSPVGRIEQYPDGVVPHGTSYGVPISGDSMEPKYHDGSVAFVQSAPAIESGEVGLFSLNGSSYIKQLVVDRANGSVRLRSLNPAYPDIEVHEGDYLYTFGRVLGSYPV